MSVTLRDPMTTSVERRASSRAELPATMQVFERGWLSSNNVLFFDDDESASLIDTGYVSHAAQTLLLVGAALSGRRLKRIFNTHLHSDHCGGNAQLQAAHGARLFIPPGLACAVTDWDEARLSFAATGQECEPFRHDALVAPGDVLQLGGLRWDVLNAPGHDPHSLILWNASDRVLISADAFWQHGFGAIFPEIEGESGFAEQREILQLIEQLAPRAVIPGHGAVFSDIDAALARAHRRLDALSASGERNARHVAKVLIKFILLDRRQISMADLIELVRGAHYFEIINTRYFGGTMENLIRDRVDELVSAGAVDLVDDAVINKDDA